MERSLPLWVFLLCILLWAIFTVMFGWAIKSTLSGSDRSGILGEAAVEIASFPKTTRQVVQELLGDEDGNVRVYREQYADLSLFEPIPTNSDIEVPSLFMKADRAAMSDGWRVLAGAFQIGGNIENAVLLISPDLEIVRIWLLDEVAVGDLEPQSKLGKLVHGMEVLRDGSIIFTFDNSISLQKFDVCGAREWATAGDFHHSVALDDTSETVWTFNDQSTIAQVSVDDGSILREISIDDVIAKNPGIDILEIRRIHFNDNHINSRETTGFWLEDPFHFNDVDPLPAAIASQFDGFEAGDLLLSSRSLNLVFVLDPDTLEVKWWRMGTVQRQHDPDWLPSGEILIFNNRMSRDYSEIITIDPNTFEKEIIVDGSAHEFYTRVRGKHQMLDDGTVVVTSAQQGRAFEVNADGDVVFEVANVKLGAENTAYVISELRWLPRDFFDAEDWQC